MHIPDGFLDLKTAAGAAVLAVAGVAVAVRQVHRELPPHKVPLLGVAAAFIFAAQMLNFPVAGGTSGHLIGGVLAAVLLGPAAAVVVMTAVLVVQCFLFQDGGVSALGANVFNMAVLAPVVGYGIYRLMHRLGLIAAAAFAGWCSTVAAAISCAGQLALSGTVAWAAAFPAMTTVHMLIGIGEGLITALVLAAVMKTRPELLAPVTGADAQRGLFQIVAYGLIIAVGLALFVAPFACSWPDGLEKVAAALGFESRAAASPLVGAPVPDYEWPGIGSPVIATAVAGVFGTVVVFALSLLLARVLTVRSKN